MWLMSGDGALGEESERAEQILSGQSVSVTPPRVRHLASHFAPKFRT